MPFETQTKKLQFAVAMLWAALLASQSTATSNKVVHYLDEKVGDLFEGDACVNTLQVGRCSISSSCTKVVCQANLTSVPVTLTIIVNRCNDPVTITTHMKSLDTALEWTHNFTHSERIAVPGYHHPHSSTVIHAFLNATFTMMESVISLEVSFQYGTNKTSLRSSTIIAQRIPVSKEGCPSIVYWGLTKKELRMSIVVAMVLLIVLVVFGCCYCCLCQVFREYKRDRRRTTFLYQEETYPIRCNYGYSYKAPRGYGIFSNI